MPSGVGPKVFLASPHSVEFPAKLKEIVSVLRRDMETQLIIRCCWHFFGACPKPLVASNSSSYFARAGFLAGIFHFWRCEA